MLRAYPMKLAANRRKIDRVLDLFVAYPQAAHNIAAHQWRLFFETGRLNKMAPVAIDTRLSARYRQTCQYQVVSMLESFLANRANDYRDAVLSIAPERLAELDARHPELAATGEKGEPVSYTRLALLYLGKYRAWYQKAPAMKGIVIPADVLRLARNILRGVLDRHRPPSMGNISLLLDEKVAKVEATADTVFPYWIRLSTLDRGKPVLLPVAGNPYYDSIPGRRKPFVQINLTPDRLSAAFVKEIAPTPRAFKTELLGIDVGIRTLMTTSEGDLFGRGLLDRLYVLDKAISALARNRQRQGLRIRCRRHDVLVNRLRAFLKNDIHRALNRMLEIRAPKEIAIERLDFRSPELSKRMNRIVQNFGRRLFRDALDAKAEQFGFAVTEVNPAYTSQTCSRCGYVDKLNRNGERFQCRHCGHVLHADVNAGRNLRSRRSAPGLASRHTPRSMILDELVSQFVERCSARPHSRPRRGILSNPYFIGFAGCRTQPYSGKSQ